MSLLDYAETSLRVLRFAACRRQESRPKPNMEGGDTTMNNDERVLLAVAGFALMVGGHKLLNAELGKLGAPHAVGALLVTLAAKS
jgi:hypothetical protein